MTLDTKLVNLRKQRCDVYIGSSRTSHLHYGNPFYGSTGESLQKYNLWLRGFEYKLVEPERRKWILKTLSNLEGKLLGCYCKSPEFCHGLVLLTLLSEKSEVTQYTHSFTEV